MKYRKKDLTEIITKGSLKRRLVLWFNHAHSGLELLSKEEETTLLNSFKVNNEERIAFNKWEDKRTAFGKMYETVDSLRRTYRFHLARLTGFAMLLYSYKETESTLNDILYILKDTPQKEEIIKLLKEKKIALGEVKEDGEGYIKLSTESILAEKKSEEYTNEGGGLEVLEKNVVNLEDILVIEKNYTSSSIGAFKGGFEALKDIHEREGFKSQLYMKLFKEWEEEVNDFQGFHLSQSPSIIKCIPNANPRVKELLSKPEFNLYPIYSEIERIEEYYGMIEDYYKKQARI